MPTHLSMYRYLAWAMALTALLAMTLFFLRAGSVISIDVPLQLQTSGDEQTNLYYIWRTSQGLPIYNNRFELPFSATVYNWLFHYSYAGVINFTQNILSLDDFWLPTIARIFTIAILSGSALIAFSVFQKSIQRRNRLDTMLCLSLALFITFGPLLGFWAMTVRADLGAFFFEILAAFLFVKLYEKDHVKATIVLVVCAYLAWSFKQSNVFSAGAAGLFLLCRRDWKSFFVLVLVLPSAWALTIWLGDPLWRHNVMMQDYPLFYTFSRLLRNLGNMGVKLLPMLLFIGGLIVVAIRSRALLKALWRNDAFLFAISGSFCAAVISVPASAQIGASENYYFSLSFFLTLSMVAALPALREFANDARLPLAGGSIGAAVVSLAILAVLTGKIGITDLRHVHTNNMRIKQCADILPRPLYVTNQYLGLPWMTPGNPHFVLSYSYPLERKLGKTFQNGGIGGMIESGQFAALLLTTNSDEVDGGSLAQYIPATLPECSEVYVFTRKP